MGLKDLSNFNTAVHHKLAWRMQHNQDLWVRVLKGIYFPNCDFLQAKKWDSFMGME